MRSRAFQWKVTKSTSVSSKVSAAARNANELDGILRLFLVICGADSLTEHALCSDVLTKCSRWCPSLGHHALGHLRTEPVPRALVTLDTMRKSIRWNTGARNILHIP